MTQQRDVQPVTGHIFMTGGAGFVGTSIRALLPNHPLRLLVRNPSTYPSLASEQVEVVQGDVTDAASLAGKIDGCGAVIHLTAVIEQSGFQTFDNVIRRGTEHVLAEAERAGVTRFLNMSALGTHRNPEYPYFHAKWQAEQAVQSSAIPWTIFRPSIIFGPGDGFINQLAGLVRKFPVLPVVGDGSAKFQPVSVNEVAESYKRALDDPATAYQIYELGGPEILTYEQILDTIRDRLDKKRPKVHVPVALIKAVVAISSPLPKAVRPPVTMDQLRMLAIDNCTADSATADLTGHGQLRLRDGLDYIAT